MKIRNSATMDFDKEERHGKGRHFVSRFMEAGLASYKSQGGKMILVRKEALDKFANSMVGCPVIIQHADVTDENVKDLAVGYVSRVWFNEADGWYYCEGVVQGEDVETLINEKNWSVSCGYIVTEKDEKGGIYHDIEYDEEVLNGDFEHLAIVPNPRYREANIVLNSSERKDMLGIFNRKKIRNSEKEETMDKRKAIDEIGGILKGKVDEEVWRTVVGIIEKIAYSESEDKKDNESDVEDKKDDDKKEEKENACRKNESEKEDEKGSDEDKKDNESEEDEKKEEKEEKKENKRNSSDFAEIKALRNSCAEVEDVVSFVPEAQRLARGMKY